MVIKILSIGISFKGENYNFTANIMNIFANEYDFFSF